MFQLSLIIKNVEEVRNDLMNLPLKLDVSFFSKKVDRSRARVSTASHQSHQKRQKQLRHEIVRKPPIEKATGFEDIDVEIEEIRSTECRSDVSCPIQINVSYDVCQLRPL